MNYDKVTNPAQEEKCPSCKGDPRGILIEVTAFEGGGLQLKKYKKCPTCHGTGKKISEQSEVSSGERQEAMPTIKQVRKFIDDNRPGHFSGALLPPQRSLEPWEQEALDKFTQAELLRGAPPQPIMPIQTLRQDQIDPLFGHDDAVSKALFPPPQPESAAQVEGMTPLGPHDSYTVTPEHYSLANKLLDRIAGLQFDDSKRNSVAEFFAILSAQVQKRTDASLAHERAEIAHWKDLYNKAKIQLLYDSSRSEREQKLETELEHERAVRKGLVEELNKLKIEDVRRIKHLNKLASWATQDVTGPWEKGMIQEWVLNEIKMALGSQESVQNWIPSVLNKKEESIKVLRKIYEYAPDSVQGRVAAAYLFPESATQALAATDKETK